jgi:hypothetical protein
MLTKRHRSRDRTDRKFFSIPNCSIRLKREAAHDIAAVFVGRLFAVPIAWRGARCNQRFIYSVCLVRRDETTSVLPPAMTH